MAIVNRTPDSFYGPGITWDETAAMDRVHQVMAEGADIIDIGGVPAAPGRRWTPSEEIRRTAGFIAAVRDAYPDVVISVDTWRHEVGRAACAAGADLINDTWGGLDPRLAEVAAEFGAGLVCSHAGPQTPRTRPLPGRLRRRHGGRAGPDAGAGRPGRAGRGGPGADRHRPGARLRQEHLALAGGHPAAGRA